MSSGPFGNSTPFPSKFVVTGGAVVVLREAMLLVVAFGCFGKVWQASDPVPVGPRPFIYAIQYIERGGNRQPPPDTQTRAHAQSQAEKSPKGLTAFGRRWFTQSTAEL